MPGTVPRVPGVKQGGGAHPTPTREDGGRLRQALPTPGPRRSHGHFCLAGCVAGVVARDVVQLLPRCCVCARRRPGAWPRRAALAQGGVRVIRGTGMRVHLCHAVAVSTGVDTKTSVLQVMHPPGTLTSRKAVHSGDSSRVPGSAGAP